MKRVMLTRSAAHASDTTLRLPTRFLIVTFSGRGELQEQGRQSSSRLVSLRSPIACVPFYCRVLTFFSEIRERLSTFGDVQYLDCKFTARFKRAFVMYFSVAAAKLAKEKLDGSFISGCSVQIEFAPASRLIRVQGLPTAEALAVQILQELFPRYEWLEVVPYLGCSYVWIADIVEAAAAVERGQGHRAGDKLLELDFIKVPASSLIRA